MTNTKPKRQPITATLTSRKISLDATRHGPITQIRLSCIHGNNPVSARVNVYQIGDTLIDAGFLYATDDLLGYLKHCPPKRILLTHHHEDHIAALNPILNTFGDIPIFAPKPLVPLIHDFEKVTTCRELFWGQAESCTAVKAYDAGEIFIESGLEIETLETPGHCPFHCSFVIRTQGKSYVLSGDLFYKRKPLSIWYESSAPDAIESCETLADLDKEIYLMPNHLDPDPSGKSTLQAQADFIKRESEKILQTSDELGTRDYAKIAEHLYGPPEPFEQVTDGQITKASFVRAVLDPVTKLPASRIKV